LSEQDEEASIADRIASVIAVLSEVTLSTFDSRLPELSDRDPFDPLYRAVNTMVETMATFQRDLSEKLATIEHQRAAIRELSTPVIEVWRGVLCLPVVGIMDTSRSADMTESLLRAVAEKRARCAIIDLTGIEVMDTAAADHFLRMAKAVRLLGAECVITGISPAIAQTIVHMGVDLDEVQTHRSLRDALAKYVTSAMRGENGSAR
jgi:rsbT co-antagonist protein RsbR